MQYAPKTKKELDESQLIPKGYYPLDCYEAEEKKSKSGNDMLVLKHKVYVGEGQRFHTDYIVTNNDMGLAKLYSFCDATGQLDRYNAGDFGADDARGKTCYAYIVQRQDKESGEIRNDLRGYFTEAEAEKRHNKDAAKQGGAAGVKQAARTPKPSDPDPSEEDDLPDFMRNS